MSFKMSKSAFKEIIQEDVDFILKHCPATLERSHVISVLNNYVDKEYLKNTALDGLCKIQSNMIVKAKFMCNNVQDQPDFQSQNVTLTAVVDGSK